MRTLNFNFRIIDCESNKTYTYGLLLIGAALMTLSHLNWNIDMLAWVSMLPFLLFLNSTKGLKSRLLFYLVLIITWSFIVLKIITDPIPYFLIPLYSIPIATIHLPGYLLYDKFKHHRLSVLIFPAAMIILEWIQYTFTPFASWGIAAYTQVDSINISQSISLFGMAGLSFMIYFTNSALCNLLITKRLTPVNSLIPLSLLVLLSVYGYLRLNHFRTSSDVLIKVAAVGTDSDIGGLPLPDFEENKKVIKAIFERSEKAANSGAKIIVWNEASFYLLPENEDAWKDSISKLSRKLNVSINASYVIPVSFSPFTYENKYVLFSPEGKILNEYLKHEPVPGEPAVKGKEDIITVKIFGSEIGGAICYDYDFPYLAQKNSKAGADIVTLPSSDWKGIDPIHTQMASFRAIEQGHSIIRSTRFGLSSCISPYGELISQMSSFDINDKILLSVIPAKRINTLYSEVGDIFVFVNIAFLIFISAHLIINDKVKKG